jgi:hypothetical protein
VQTDCESGEDGIAITFGAAVECFGDMLEARLHRDPVAGKQRALCRAAGEAFKRGEAMLDGKLTDGVHAGMKIERRQAGTGVTNLGDPKADLHPHVGEGISRHKCPS